MKTACISLLAAVLAENAAPVVGQYVPFNLVSMSNSVQEHGAMCLDGSPIGFYWSPGFGDGANNWQFYEEGGGWCYDEADCYGRSNTTLGSSKNWPTQGYLGGLFSSDCNKNPKFCNWNKVWLPYCDGMSFSGDREEPVYYNNTALWFRGRRNLDAIMSVVTSGGMSPLPSPWGNAFDIVLSGCSAGGLAAYLHADYFGAKYASNVRPPPPGSNYTRNGRFYVIPMSGFFLDAPNIEGQRVYTDQIKSIFYLANATNGVNAACVADQKPGEEYLCGMAPHTYKYIQSRIFVTNSMYDSWQVPCILTSEPVSSINDTKHNGNCSAVPGWYPCASNPENCTSVQMVPVNNYRSEFITALNGTATAAKNGNAGFLTSCHTHCEAQQDDNYLGNTIDGVTLRDAIYEWMDADPSSPPTFYWDCEYNVKGQRKNCNPTCPLN